MSDQIIQTALFGLSHRMDSNHVAGLQIHGWSEAEKEIGSNVAAQMLRMDGAITHFAPIELRIMIGTALARSQQVRELRNLIEHKCGLATEISVREDCALTPECVGKTWHDVARFEQAGPVKGSRMLCLSFAPSPLTRDAAKYQSLQIVALLFVI